MNLIESKNVWAPLKRELDKRRWDYVRLESKVSLGLPDVNVHIPGRGDVWIELKAAEMTGGAVDLGLRREQYLWLRKAKMAGRRVYLLGVVRINSRSSVWHLWNTIEAFALAKKRCPYIVLMGLSAFNTVKPSKALEFLETGRRS